MQDNNWFLKNKMKKDCTQTPKKYAEQNSSQQIGSICCLQDQALEEMKVKIPQMLEMNACSTVVNIPAQEHVFNIIT